MAKLRLAVGPIFEGLVFALAQPIGRDRVQRLQVMLHELHALVAGLQDVIAAEEAELAKRGRN